MSTNLFEKYGGFATVSTIVRQFYKDILLSPNLKGYFEGVDMENLIDHQTKFISHVLGGPAEYTGRTLAVSHQGLKITSDDFDEVAEILQETLEDAGMSDDDVETVMGIVGSVKNDIVESE